MKAIHFKLILPIFFLISTIAISQTSKSVIIDNVSEDIVWPIVYKTFKDLKLKYPLINKKTGIGETNFFHYNTMLAKNRAKYKLIYKNSTLTISLFERQYLSKSRWVENILPISKKQNTKLLAPIKKRIIELLKNKTIKEAINIPKIGMYESFSIIKTGDPNMDLLAIHENGNLLGFDLWESNKTVKSLIFKESFDSNAITMLFDEKGFPKGMITSEYVIHISSSDNKMAKLTVYDLLGNPIGNEQIDFPYPENSSIKIENNHGPSDPNISIIINEDYISLALSVAATATKLVGCATGVATAVTGVGAVLAGVACTSLFLDVIVNELPKEHYMYKKLSLASDISGLASIPVLKSLNIAGKTLNLDQTVEVIGALASAVKISYENCKDIFNKNPNKTISPIITNNDSQAVVIPIESNMAHKRTIIELAHEAINKITSIKEKIKSLRKVANESNYLKIAIDIQKLEKSIEPIKKEYTEKIKTIAQKRTIKYIVKKTDPDGPYYNISKAEVMGFKWGKYGGPSVELEVFFQPIRTIKTVKQFNRELKFYQDLKQFSFSFEDGSTKPLKYALLISDKIRKERKVKTILRIKDFEKEIKTLNFYKSNAKTTKKD